MRLLRYPLAALVLALAACGDDDDDDGNGNGGDQNACVPSYAVGDDDPAGVATACHQGLDVVCERAFGECATEFEGVWASLEECQAEIDDICDEAQYADYVPNQPGADACQTAVEGATCASLAERSDPGLSACLTFLSVLPPEPQGSETVETGSTTEGEITGDETKTWGGTPAVTYGICLDAGNTVSVTLTEPTTGGIEDPILGIYGPDGEEVAFNDDASATNLYPQLTEVEVLTSGAYLIVVSNLDPADVGGFVMEIEVQ